MRRFYFILLIQTIAMRAMDAPPSSFYKALLSAIIEKRIAKNQNLNEPIGKRLFEPIHSDYMNSETLLYASVGSDQYLSLTKRLLKNGADPNFSSSEWRHIPLFYAIRHCAVKTVHTLLRAGANPLATVYGSDKLTLLHYICQDLRVRVSDRPRLKESKKIVHLLLKYGADPNKQSTRVVDRDPLYELCFTNQKTRPIIILLLKYGADISLLDETGKDLIAAAEHSIESLRGRYDMRVHDGLIFLKDWAAGKIKLKKKKIK